MSKLDRLIEEALSDEDRDILRQTEELGWFALGASQFRGKLGWVAWVLMIVQSVLFLIGAWMAWHFFNAGDVLTALKWGLPSVTLLVVATVLKTSLMPQLQADRILRELKRVELLIAQRSA